MADICVIQSHPVYNTAPTIKCVNPLTNQKNLKSVVVNSNVLQFQYNYKMVTSGFNYHDNYNLIK